MVKILDPQESFLQKWYKIIFFSCVIATSLDALFFYVPVIDGKKKCLSFDNKLVIAAIVLRSFIDIFYILFVIFQFLYGYIASSRRLQGRFELIEGGGAIAERSVSSCFIIDILAILPIPQVVILVAVGNPRVAVALITEGVLKYVILFQYVPRLTRLYPLYKEVTRTSGVLTESAWAGAALNLFLYTLASHVIGALWYLLAIEREESCWRIACRDHECNYHYLYCREDRVGDYSFLNSSCLLLQPNEIKDLMDFDFGIFLDALQSHVVEMRDFLTRFLYCFWWGLRNLSSFGQNLRTSTFVAEMLFAVFISIVGLVLFSLFIGNMQKYLHSLTSRIEQMRVRREDAERWEQWMSKRMLPEDQRERIRRHEQYKWQETRGVEEESLFRKLPIDIRRDVKRHLYLALLSRVPMFERMDEQLLEEMCDHLKSVLYTENSYMIREGHPVEAMLFIMRGTCTITNGGKTGMFNSDCLKVGDFCGEEILTWSLDPRSSSQLPLSTRTVEVLTRVEALAIMADDLKLVASQFRRMHEGKLLQHTFRFYSAQWRTWAARYIQAAWHRYCCRKLEKTLHEEEGRLQDAVADDVGNSSPNLGVTLYASMFATNLLQRKHAHDAELSLRPPPSLLLKPDEPDFNNYDH